MQNRRVTIIQTLLQSTMWNDSRRYNGYRVMLDFVSLYGDDNIRVFRSSETLQNQLFNLKALSAIGQPTGLETYKQVLPPYLETLVRHPITIPSPSRQVLLPYLETLVPDIAKRIERMEELGRADLDAPNAVSGSTHQRHRRGRVGRGALGRGRGESDDW